MGSIRPDARGTDCQQNEYRQNRKIERANRERVLAAIRSARQENFADSESILRDI